MLNSQYILLCNENIKYYVKIINVIVHCLSSHEGWDKSDTQLGSVSWVETVLMIL